MGYENVLTFNCLWLDLGNNMRQFPYGNVKSYMFKLHMAIVSVYSNLKDVI